MDVIIRKKGDESVEKSNEGNKVWKEEIKKRFIIERN